ncbi:uncharacterized protein LOC123201441 isoform X2 [Mangifera indica]|uniref:uncharacterized protein LOC123201441 isoform X2 n=1 Tax=Mangifera indica TaxID=29780 RepID=UPI001CFA0DEB|nr:uncharacterized protein LOC123201441 isoform X2 [Mangifera indica]
MMDSSKIESLEEKLKTLLAQLQAEFGVFERLVYKNKNQHRRSSYFQYLLKVRRDLRLLQSTKLEELLSCCFQVITGKRPKQKVHLLESLKRRKCDGGKYNFMERLLGAARLLSQMVEPMLKAATEISTLLARSFFMSFSLTILALLARLRVLVQQILLDIVSVFNAVSLLSQKKQSVKIAQEGIEVYREFYPANQEYITLESVWSTDKFILLEKSNKSNVNSQEGDSGSKIPVGDSAVPYQSLEAFLGDSEKVNNNRAAAEQPTTNIDENKINLLASLSDDGKPVDSTLKLGENSGTSETPCHELTSEGGLLVVSHSSPSSNPSTVKSGTKKVAFVSVSVKRPAPSTSTSLDQNIKEIEKKSDEPEDKFYNLLTGGNFKDSLF